MWYVTRVHLLTIGVSWWTKNRQVVGSIYGFSGVTVTHCMVQSQLHLAVSQPSPKRGSPQLQQPQLTLPQPQRSQQLFLLLITATVVKLLAVYTNVTNVGDTCIHFVVRSWVKRDMVSKSDADGVVARRVHLREIRL